MHARALEGGWTGCCYRTRWAFALALPRSRNRHPACAGAGSRWLVPLRDERGRPHLLTPRWYKCRNASASGVIGPWGVSVARCWSARQDQRPAFCGGAVGLRPARAGVPSSCCVLSSCCRQCSLPNAIVGSSQNRPGSLVVMIPVIDFGNREPPVAPPTLAVQVVSSGPSVLRSCLGPSSHFGSPLRDPEHRKCLKQIMA